MVPSASRMALFCMLNDPERSGSLQYSRIGPEPPLPIGLSRLQAGPKLEASPWLVRPFAQKDRRQRLGQNHQIQKQRAVFNVVKVVL